jgi:hypothetical protein
MNHSWLEFGAYTSRSPTVKLQAPNLPELASARFSRPDASGLPRFACLDLWVALEKAERTRAGVTHPDFELAKLQDQGVFNRERMRFFFLLLAPFKIRPIGGKGR